MIVLLEKQVHLQKDVGAGRALVRCMDYVNGGDSDIQAARERDRKERNSKKCCQVSLAMLFV